MKIYAVKYGWETVEYGRADDRITFNNDVYHSFYKTRAAAEETCRKLNDHVKEYDDDGEPLFYDYYDPDSHAVGDAEVIEIEVQED